MAMGLAVLSLWWQAGTQGVAVAATSPPTQEVVRARLIELVSADGRVVAQLHTDQEGGANLRLRDGRGEVRVKLGATGEGAGLILMSGGTEPAVWLQSSRRDGAIRILRDGQLRDMP